MEPIITAGLIGAGSQLLGNLMNRDSTRETNQDNINFARENRDWQEKMSNTAHTREMADLKNAGLNPILAAHGGSSSPSPGMPSLEAPQVDMPDAMQVMNFQQAKTMNDEQIKNNVVDRALKGAQVQSIMLDNNIKKSGADLGKDASSVYQDMKNAWKNKNDKQENMGFKIKGKPYEEKPKDWMDYYPANPNLP